MKLTKLKTKYMGRNFIYYNEIDSTQKEIWRRIEKNEIENGTAVMAEFQTKGVGTHGRIWHTDESKNIAFSFFVKTNCTQNKLQGLTIEIAQIIVDIFKETYNVKIDIKTPNDLIIKYKKTGGILTESKMQGELVKFLVIGLGINTSKMNFTKDIEDIATSIKKSYGIEVDRDFVLSEFCNRFEKALERRLEK